MRSNPLSKILKKWIATPTSRLTSEGKTESKSHTNLEFKTDSEVRVERHALSAIKMKSCEAPESRPLRGAEALKQGGSSAAATLELEADKRGTPLDCRKEKAEALFFSGLRGEWKSCEREGINPFSFCDKATEEVLESKEVKAVDSKKVDSESEKQTESAMAEDSES